MRELTLLFCRPKSGPVRLPCTVSLLRQSSLYRVEDDIHLGGSKDDRVIARKGWILKPVHRGHPNEAAFAVHPDLLGAMRAVANAIADVQSGFAQRLGRDARFQLLFGTTLTEAQILEKLGKSRAELSRQSGILNAMDDWLQALWEERETALAAVRAVYESAIVLHDHHEQWPSIKAIWTSKLPDLACAPFEAFAFAVRTEIDAGGAEPSADDTQRMAEEISAQADALMGDQLAEDVDLRLSRVESCLRRAPERRRTEALEHLAGANVLLDAYLEKCRRYLTTGPGSKAFHGTRWNLEIAKRMLERRNPRALLRLKLARERLATLTGRAY